MAKINESMIDEKLSKGYDNLLKLAIDVSMKKFIIADDFF